MAGGPGELDWSWGGALSDLCLRLLHDDLFFIHATNAPALALLFITPQPHLQNDTPALRIIFSRWSNSGDRRLMGTGPVSHFLALSYDKLLKLSVYRLWGRRQSTLKISEIDSLLNLIYSLNYAFEKIILKF